MRLVLTNATLIDCIDPEPVAGASVVVEDGRIAEITSGGHSPSGDGARVIDLEAAHTCFPDCGTSTFTPTT